MLNDLFVKKTLNAISVTLLCATFLSQSVLGMEDDYNYKNYDSDTTNSTYIEEDSEDAQSWQFEYYEEHPNSIKNTPNNCNDEYITTNNFPIFSKENSQEIPEKIEDELEKKKVKEFVNKLQGLLKLDKNSAKELSEYEAKTIVKSLVNNLNEKLLSKLIFFNNLSTKKLEKKEIKKIVNKLNEKLSSNQGFSDKSPKLKEKINKLEKESSLTTSKKILRKDFREKYKSLTNEFKITKSMPTLKIEKENEKKDSFITINPFEEEMTKSFPILKTDNNTVIDHKKNPYQDVQDTLEKRN